jgi:RNA polymerase sigma-70 factor (ECF subfamily)
VVELLEIIYSENFDSLVSALTAFSRDEQAAEDAVQQAFLQALKHRETLEAMPEKSARSWLYATAKNALVDAKRRSKRLLALDPDVEQGYTPPDIADSLTVTGLLAALPGDLRQIVELRYFTGLNATDIGQSLGIPPATVRTKLRSALQKMRFALDN